MRSPTLPAQAWHSTPPIVTGNQAAISCGEWLLDTLSRPLQLLQFAGVLQVPTLPFKPASLDLGRVV
jgi:hypothetical protein